MANKINYLNEFSNSLLMLMNSELKNRPTFMQVHESFKLNIPRVKDALVEEEEIRIKKRKELDKNNVVRCVSQKYFDQNEMFDTQGIKKDKDPY